MSLASALFSAAVAARNTLYDRGWRKARRLQGPVVSIGNLSTGGAGKTPFVILLGELLAQRGVAFDILSRGYGRETHGVLEVQPEGSPRDFGDEPLLLAQRLQVPVFVGEDRHAAGLAAERQYGPRLHLLDDGFQHRALARDFDIVLVTPDDARDRLLPAGRLREPPASLRRADAIVLVSGAEAASFPAAAGKTLWRARRGIVTGELPSRPVAFCGIARARNFFAHLRTAGVEPAAEAVYRDHHAYSASDVASLLRLREQSEAGGFVTTEKDIINLGAQASALHPLGIVRVRMELQEAQRALDAMFDTLAARRASRTAGSASG